MNETSTPTPEQAAQAAPSATTTLELAEWDAVVNALQRAPMGNLNFVQIATLVRKIDAQIRAQVEAMQAQQTQDGVPVLRDETP